MGAIVIDDAKISFRVQVAAGTLELVVRSVSIGTVFAAHFVRSKLKDVYSVIHEGINLGVSEDPLDSLILNAIGNFDEII